jgi:alpha-D-ribose 1-methylphosphonate 5-triphosphate diphosphatase
VDLHGDGFERHLSPRPTAPFEKAEALRSAAAELAANGVTTAWFAQSWSWEGGFRAGTEAEAILAALDRIRPRLLPDVRMQIRLETHVLPEHPRVLDAVRRHGVDYIVFNNHLPEAVDLARQARPLRRLGGAAPPHARGADGARPAAMEQEPEVPAALARSPGVPRDGRPSRLA